MLCLHLEYTVLIIPFKEGTIELEKVERTVAQGKRGMVWLPYEERLNRLRFFSLKKKWLMVDMVNVYYR